VNKAQVSLYVVGGGALIAGGVFAFKANKSRQSAGALCRENGVVYCPRTAAQHINDDWMYSTLADISFGVGGIAVVGTTLWMLIANGQSTGHSSALQVVPMGHGLGLAGNF
jgi:hypothetical protein